MAAIFGCLGIDHAAFAQGAKPRVIHDSEYYIPEAQHGQEWAAQDVEIDQKFAELRKKYGATPNIIHIMWDDMAVGEIGIPAIQKVRGFETPNINRLAVEGINFTAWAKCCSGASWASRSREARPLPSARPLRLSR